MLTNASTSVLVKKMKYKKMRRGTTKTKDTYTHTHTCYFDWHSKDIILRYRMHKRLQAQHRIEYRITGSSSLYRVRIEEIEGWSAQEAADRLSLLTFNSRHLQMLRCSFETLAIPYLHPRTRPSLHNTRGRWDRMACKKKVNKRWARGKACESIWVSAWVTGRVSECMS